eukprot:scpid88132/ scgid26574/ 
MSSSSTSDLESIPCSILPPSITSSPSGSSPGSGAKQIRFDLTMDLLMLRQVCATENTFVCGSPAFDEVAAAMQSLGDSRFHLPLPFHKASHVILPRKNV